MAPSLGIRIDPADPDYSPLLSAGGRISKLFAIADARKDEHLQSTLDLLLGAVYALCLAQHAGYVHRPGVAQPDKVATRANDVGNGWLRTDGKWIAGFHFNSGILRIAAVYHRALKIVLNKPTTNEYAPVLRQQVQAQRANWDANALVIHDEVNDVKHGANGLHAGRTATPQKALDEILTLIEQWV